MFWSAFASVLGTPVYTFITHIVHDSVQVLFLKVTGGTPDKWEANRDWSTSIKQICSLDQNSLTGLADKVVCETWKETKIAALKRPPRLQPVGFTANSSASHSASSAPARLVKQALNFVFLAAFGLLLV